jgi:glycosyltransferase involved in cell wall biosynthesis
MKILYINTFYAPHYVGGAEYSLQVIVETMHKKGHKVVVLATSNKKGLHQEIINEIKVYRVGIKGWDWLHGYSKYPKFKKILWHIQDVYNIKMAKYVKEIISIEKPDLVSCHNITGLSIAIWDVIKKEKIAIIQVVHDFYFLCLKSMIFRNKKVCNRRCVECRIMRVLHQKKSKKIDAVVGISQYIIDKIEKEKCFDKSLKKVIYNARIIPDSNTNNRQISTSDTITFGFIGRLVPPKGIQWIIEQFKNLHSDRILLKIAGQGSDSYMSFLKYISADDKRISFIGYISSKEFYSQIDVLIVPSLWNEPLGMVAVESCSYHIPVITSGAGGLKEIIIDGYNGLHCDASNPKSLLDAINRIINDRSLLKQLSDNARISVSSFLDTDRLIREYEDIYKATISHKIL